MDEACYLASVENNTGFPEAMTHVIGRLNFFTTPVDDDDDDVIFSPSFGAT